MTTENTPKKALWEYPWGYRESFVIAAEILLLGLILEFLTGGNGIAPLTMPYNFYALFAFVGILLFLYIRFKGHPIIKWLSGVPAAISSISVFAILTLLMGFIPQSESYRSGFIDLIGFTHLKSSWALVLVQIFLLTTLGMVTIRRATPLKGKNIGFLLNHLGLWITLVAATLGTGDLKRLSINLLEDGKPINLAIPKEGDPLKLPFSLKLLDFHMDQWVPRIALVDANSGKFILNKGESAPPDLALNKEIKLKNWTVRVDSFYQDAIYTDSMLMKKEMQGSCPAAFVHVKNQTNGRELAGWISTGSFAFNPLYIPLGNDEIIGLTLPEAKKFQSKVVVFEDSTAVDTVTIEVNKPYTVKGWKVYQLSYDENKGKWSNLSVLEVVSDPWLKLVYIGIFMMLAGAVYLFWMGRQKIN